MLHIATPSEEDTNAEVFCFVSLSEVEIIKKPPGLALTTGKTEQRM